MMNGLTADALFQPPRSWMYDPKRLMKGEERKELSRGEMHFGIGFQFRTSKPDQNQFSTPRTKDFGLLSKLQGGIFSKVNTYAIEVSPIA